MAGAALALTACGDEAPKPALDEEIAHVHGLGINPADGALYIATHRGLFRAAAGDKSPERVGDRFQDTMGFTIVGPNRFLGSGHPDVRTDEPPLLGLIESRDAGRTWDALLLSGEADFHVMRTAGSVFYAYDAHGNRLLGAGPSGWRGCPLHQSGPAPMTALRPSGRPL